ncbi:MAG: hypothetical protein PHT99_01720 [Methanoregula sp.]|nr:hypothetical protein [Methanoregula sp.]
MKKLCILTVGLMLMALAVMPVQAFTMKSLSINLEQNGDAEIAMQYDLSFIEQSAVFLHIADPAGELQSAFRSGSATAVTVTEATSSSARITVPVFASVATTDGKTVIATPSVSFERARDVLNSYWFAPLISPDFSPAVTIVTFPDGHHEYFYDQISIPSVAHSIT